MDGGLWFPERGFDPHLSPIFFIFLARARLILLWYCSYVVKEFHMKRKEFAKKVRTAIKENTDPSMDRMLAWQKVILAGVDIDWELFKRFWRETR